MPVIQFRTSIGVVACLSVSLAPSFDRAARLQAQAQAQTSSAASLVGAWTLNKDLSDQPPDRSSSSTEGNNNGGSGGGRHGGGYGGGGGGGAGAAVDPEQAARMRTAMQDLMNPPDHLTIVQADNMMVLTGPDGRTTRLSLDGKKIKDESTKIERSTKWDGSKLVSEIKGVGSAKITETYSIDAEHHQMRVALDVENTRRPLMLNRVYDADPR